MSIDGRVLPQPRWRRAAYVGCLLGLGLLAVGCQSYERRPLDLPGHAAAWPERDVKIGLVADYARRIAASSGLPATPFEPEDGITRIEAEAIALYFNPALRVARAESNVPLAGAQQAGRWEDPELSAGIMRIVDRGRGDRWGLAPPGLAANGNRGITATPPVVQRVDGDYVDDPWIVGAGLSLTIPLSGRLAAEKAAAWGLHNVTLHRVLVEEINLLERLRATWLTWSANIKRIELMEEYLGELDDVLDVAVQLASVGELRPTEVRVLRIERAERRAALRTIRAQADQDRLLIIALMGLAPETPFTLVPHFAVPSLHALPEDARPLLLQRHSRIQLAQAEYELAERNLATEIRKQYPDLTIGPEYGLEEGSPRLGMSFGFKLPLWNRNRQGIAEALAQRESARAHAEATCEEVIAEYESVKTALEAARAHGEALRDQVAPLVDAQVEETRELIQLGETDVLLLRDALEHAVETKLAVLDAALEEALAANDLLTCCGPSSWLQASGEMSYDDK